MVKSLWAEVFFSDICGQAGAVRYKTFITGLCKHGRENVCVGFGARVEVEAYFGIIVHVGCKNTGDIMVVMGTWILYYDRDYLPFMARVTLNSLRPTLHESSAMSM